MRQGSCSIAIESNALDELEMYGETGQDSFHCSGKAIFSLLMYELGRDFSSYVKHQRKQKTKATALTEKLILLVSSGGKPIEDLWKIFWKNLDPECISHTYIEQVSCDTTWIGLLIYLECSTFH